MSSIASPHFQDRGAEQFVWAASDAAFYLMVIHGALTFLLAGLIALFHFAFVGQTSGELIGAFLAMFMALYELALFALLAFGLIMVIPILRLRFLIDHRAEHDLCVVLSVFVMIIIPHGSWYGLRIYRNLSRPGVPRLFKKGHTISRKQSP